MEDALIHWWTKARPFFERHLPAILSQLDDDAHRLQKLTEANQAFCVCVLGQSAVGKSTLLNAIVAKDDTILPAGGIGPLTALATEVRHSSEAYFRVTYRDKRQLSGFRLQLERELKRQGLIEDDIDDDLTSELERGSSSLRDTQTEDNNSSAPPRDEAFMELTKQIAQIITGDQFRPLALPEIVQGFRVILGLKSSRLDGFCAEDQARMLSAAETLSQKLEGPARSYSKAQYPERFDSLLRQHVSGNLAPLVERIEVGYPASALRSNIVLVDLPGVGIANDRYRSVTSDYVRLKASAVLLVVDRAGPTEASVNLIRESGYWDRLLLSSTDPERDPCNLLIAVTKVDDVARERYIQSKALPKEERPTVAALFTTLREEVRSHIRTQAEHCFNELSEGPATDAEVVASRSSAQVNLLKSLEVFPVSATEYRILLADDEDQHAFIKDESSSGIPDLVERLDQLALQQEQRFIEIRCAVSNRLGRNVSAALEQITHSWSAKARATAEAEALRNELMRFLEPKRLDLANRTGQFREFLDTSGTAKIGELVAKAQIAAQIEVSHYLRRLRHAHWATLRATVVRGGAYVSGQGLRVDLAADVAQRFQEPMAGIWGRTLLTEIRERTRRHGKTLETVISEICEWADQRTDSAVQSEVLAAQQSLMKDRVAQLSQVGSEAVDDLKDAIKRELMATIEKPIRLKCQAFRDRGDAIGPGVKNRILELFDDLATEAVSAAAQPAVTLLQKQFVGVRIEITKALEDWGDPIEQAADAIVEREEARRLRSDAQKRKSVLLELEELRTELPTAAHSELAERVPHQL